MPQRNNSREFHEASFFFHASYAVRKEFMVFWNNMKSLFTFPLDELQK